MLWNKIICIIWGTLSIIFLIETVMMYKTTSSSVFLPLFSFVFSTGVSYYYAHRAWNAK